MLSQLIHPQATIPKLQARQGDQISVHQPPQRQSRFAVIQPSRRGLPAQTKPATALLTHRWTDPVEHPRSTVR